MKTASETYGAASFAGKLHLARVENDGARSRVTALVTTDDNLHGDGLNGGRLFFGVDNRLAVVKKIQIRQNPGFDAIEMARFEIAQSLLDPPEAFYFDTLPLENRNGYLRYLTIAYHREEIDRLIEFYQEKLRKPSGFKLHAAALVDGYKAFCRREPGDLQVLADVQSDMVTAAIVYKDKLHAAMRLETTPGETISSISAKKLAAELKLTLSFNLAELFAEGITVPISRMILSGRHARDQMIQTALKDQFPSDITLPHFNEGYFQPVSEIIGRYPPERFLIPLGLAVE